MIWHEDATISHPPLIGDHDPISVLYFLDSPHSSSVHPRDALCQTPPPNLCGAFLCSRALSMVIAVPLWA